MLCVFGHSLIIFFNLKKKKTNIVALSPSNISICHLTVFSRTKTFLLWKS